MRLCQLWWIHLPTGLGARVLIAGAVGLWVFDPAIQSLAQTGLMRWRIAASTTCRSKIASANITGSSVDAPMPIRHSATWAFRGINNGTKPTS
jgi:hypothetical protein